MRILAMLHTRAEAQKEENPKATVRRSGHAGPKTSLLRPCRLGREKGRCIATRIAARSPYIPSSSRLAKAISTQGTVLPNFGEGISQAVNQLIGPPHLAEALFP